MKTNIFFRLGMSFATLLALVAGGCDQTHIDEDPTAGQKPVIESFSPAQGAAGTEIVITGRSLQGVTRATIGGREVTISERVSDTQLSLRAGDAGASGTIVLYNAAGNTESADVFTYLFPVPALLGVTDAETGEAIEAAQMDQHLLLAIENLNVVQSVWFTAADETAEGSDKVFEATISDPSYDDGIIEIIVPYVNSDNASILLQYYDGTGNVFTTREAAQLTVSRNAPVFSTQLVARAAAGMPVYVEGENLHHVQHIWVGDCEAVIDAQSSGKLRFLVPEALVEGMGSDFESEPLEVRAEYFFGNEEQTLSESLTVFVPNLKFWPSRNVWAQGRVAYSGFESFFSPETGEVYHNSLWSTVVDPVAFAHKDNICRTNVPQHDKITREEYESVAPYFFFSGANAGNLAINSPGNSNSQLRNFYKTSEGTANAARITESDNSIEASGTPVLYFRYLDPTNATQNALIEQVRNGTLTAIDETTFPINIGKKQVAGISVPTSGNPNTGTWCKAYPAGTDAADFDVDAVLMVVYCGYDYEGNDSASPIINNIKRIGLVHVRTINFRVIANNANVPPSGSDILFDCYWQTTDYDYSMATE